MVHPKTSPVGREDAPSESLQVALWMIERGYATGHGDTVEDMLNELDWQIRERVLRPIHRLARSDGGRTFDGCIRDLGLIDDLCRADL